MGAVCCGPAEPELNPDGTKKALPSLEQQARDPEELRRAARNDDAEALETLLKRMPKMAINSGAPSNEATPDQVGMTALHYAAQRNWLTGVRLLVLYGASQRVKTAGSAGGKTPLHLAVEAGKRKVVAFLLELDEEPPKDPKNVPKPWKSADLYATDAQGRNIVLATFLTGRQQFTTWFIGACGAYERQLRYDSADKGGETVPLACARFGWWELLKTKVLPCLDDSGKVINVANRDGETVLGWLLKNLLVGKMTVANVQEWLGTLKGVDVSIPVFTERIPPICMAIAHGSRELFDFMLSMTQATDTSASTPKLLLAKDVTGKGPLHYAGAYGHKELAAHLVSLGCQVWTAGLMTKCAPPFHLAALRGHGDVARALIDTLPDDKRAKALTSLDGAGRSMAHICLMSKRSDDASQDAIISMLGLMDESWVSTPVQDKKKMDTPLLLAVTHHLDKVVELMIQKGVDCNQANVLQETPLARNMASVTQATAAKDARIFTMLIQAGATVDVPIPAKHPLMAVCKSSSPEFSALAVRTLEDLALGKIQVATEDNQEEDYLLEPPEPLDWNKADEEGRGPFMLAAAHNNTYIIKYLANKFSYMINQPNRDKGGNGMTPLMYAASNARVEAVRLLLDLGADVKMKDDDGRTALWHALRLDTPDTLDCAAMLLLKGARTKGCKGEEWLDAVGEGWLHRAVRMGAPDFIRLWAKCGGWFNIQCTTNEAARDLPGRDETAAEDIDLIDRPMEPTEEEVWENEDNDGIATKTDTLRIDVNSKWPKLTEAQTSGPVGEGTEDDVACSATDHKWFDTLTYDNLPCPDQDDPVYEDYQALIDDMKRKQRTGRRYDAGCLDPCDLQYHTLAALVELQRQNATAGPVSEGYQGVVCEKAFQDNVVQRVEQDLDFTRQLLAGSDPLSPETLRARRMGPGPQLYEAGPVAEAKDLLDSVQKDGKKSLAKATANRVVNNDPYFTQVKPENEDAYACRKYAGEPEYITKARAASEPFTGAQLDARADELHARLKAYTDRDKTFDSRMVLSDGALKARNICWWNISLGPDEYALKLGSWRQLEKKRLQAIKEAAARTENTPAEPCKRSAWFGLPDMPTRPELLATGALTYAVRLCRPDCVSAILDLSVGVVNQTDGYGYPALSYALCMLARDPTNKTLSYIVDRLLLARPDANLLSRIKPVHDAKLRKDLVKFVRRNMKQFGDCWVDSHVAGGGCFGGGFEPDEDVIIAKLYKKLTSKDTESDPSLQEWKESARSCLRLCRADPLEPLIACVAMGDQSRLAWLVRRCGAIMESAWVHLPDIPIYYQGLLERDVARCLSVVSPLHVAVAMRSFDLAKLVLDLGGDPNACGTPIQDDTHNPWAYSKSLDKIRSDLLEDWRDEMSERKSSSDRRREVDEEVLPPASATDKKIEDLMEGTPGSSLFMMNTPDEEIKCREFMNKVSGGLMAKLKRFKRIIMSIEIPGFTRPHPWVTPLHMAARAGQAGIAFLLVERGASPDGGASRQYARRSPVQEAIMYARANFVEYNFAALRPHHEEMHKDIQECIPDMNEKLQSAAAMDMINQVSKLFDPISGSIKAFALSVKAIVWAFMEMRNRPIAHWDPALSTAHVLLRARAPYDVAEAQTTILLRDLMDNGTWRWLGEDCEKDICDEKWTGRAAEFAARLQRSPDVGYVPMAKTCDLKFYRFATKYFTNRCDGAYFGEGTKALSEVYDALSLRALERSAKLTETRLAALKKERADIMQAVKEERQKLLADQAPGLIAMRESAAKQLGSAFVFDPESLKILEDDAETLNQKLQEEAAKTAAYEAQIRSKAVENKANDWETTEMLGNLQGGIMAVAAGANIGDEVLKLTDNVPGVPDISDATDLKGAANTMVDKARTAAVDKVDEKFEAARDKLLEAEMKPLDKAKAGSKFAEPGVKPLQASPDDSAMQFLARTAAKDTSKLILNNMQALAKNAAQELAVTAAQAVLDPVLIGLGSEGLKSAADKTMRGATAAVDAATELANRTENITVLAASEVMDLKPSLEVDVDGALAAANDVTEGINDMLEFMDDVS